MPTPIALSPLIAPPTLSGPSLPLLPSESDLYIFVDGPRTEQEKEHTDAIRRIAKNASGWTSLKKT